MARMHIEGLLDCEKYVWVMAAVSSCAKAYPLVRCEAKLVADVPEILCNKEDI